jgi:NDP-sugar pyrophosphorylase family protein
MENFQIIIPMSGFGERFRAAGYDIPKPLIEVEGKPIIAHVIDMFPGENDFIFICNQKHLSNNSYRMKEVLDKYCPTGRIIGVEPHKFGPVYAVLKVRDLIDSSKPTIVNYCDFTCYWDWDYFKNFIITKDVDGAIPSYKGFHPHSLGSTNYAYIKESNGEILDVQEKQPFTDNRMEEFASSGTYFFSSGLLMLDAFDYVIDNNINIGGEYYVSLSYKYLISMNKSIVVYPLQHFMQWGTPEDLAEYNNWSNIFHNLICSNGSDEASSGSLIIPMAGLGKRFVDDGFTRTKPMIPVSGKPMVFQAVDDLPNVENKVFVIRKDMLEYDIMVDKFYKYYSNPIIQHIKSINNGQACTVLSGLDVLEKKKKCNLEPITVSACDNGVIYNEKKLKKLIESSEVDVIVWGIRGHISAMKNPEMFGWIDESEGDVKSVSVKKQLHDSQVDPIIIGTFTFKKASYIRDSIKKLINRNGRVNGEFYVDSCINDAIESGLNCHYFEVDAFVSWGTPDDYRIFKYWQSCFHKWGRHPYSIELDRHIDSEAVQQLSDEYKKILPT